ncbi:DUF4817 domain-containing protein [Trichonephila clavipes]|nr:DUF4817 domain-containing protein [Trichonephila clavipes]
MFIYPFPTDQRASRKIATSEQKAFCVLQFAMTESAIIMQRAFRIKFSCQPPNDSNIRRWYHQFETTGCLFKGESHFVLVRHVRSPVLPGMHEEREEVKGVVTSKNRALQMLTCSFHHFAETVQGFGQITYLHQKNGLKETLF